MQTFGARFRAARNARKLTQQRVGDALGVSNTAVSRWESDLDQPQFGVLAEMRRVLGISLDELICGERPKGISEEAALYQAVSDEDRALIGAVMALPSEKRKALALLLR